MFQSIAAAEKAALEGQGQDFDTQQCRDLQNELLSSSPPLTTDATSRITSTIDDLITSNPLPQVNDDVDVENPQHAESEAVKSAQPANPPGLTSDLQPATRDDAVDTQRPVKRNIINDGGNELRRFFDEERNEYQGPDFKRRRRAIREAMMMEDLTQKSSMSLTQENPPSAYDQFDIQKIIRHECPSTATPDDDRDAREVLATQNDSHHSRQHVSTRTESTVHTYEENDPRYIKLDFDPAPAGVEDEDENVSQDASFAASREEPQNAHSYEPQTPAPPVNPFGRKGSVLKPSQMFGATQPSSIGRHLTSPTSSRPSPNVYNDFSSPPKRHRIISSPLGARVEDTSPLQSSVRNILAGSSSTDVLLATVPRTSGVQSFDTGPRIQRTENAHEPRPYLSMQESQERRNKGLGDGSDTDSDGSDSSIEARPRKRKMEREKLIRQELSSVGRIPPSSSRPASATSAVVEVPSTGRRRSWQEEYVAQCAGLDVRDTQQDDIIVDSQTALDQDEPLQLAKGDLPSNSVEANFMLADEPLASRVRNLRDSEDQTTPQEPDVPAVPLGTILPSINRLSRNPDELQEAGDTSSALLQPSLPLQELSSNGNNLRTPMANKNQMFSDGSETVPETSPPEERLRPMGEIANISFAGDGDDDMTNLPGFTQDIEFDNAMRMPSFSQPPRATANRKNPASTLVAESAELSEVATSHSDPPPLIGLEKLSSDTSTNPEQAALVDGKSDDKHIQAPAPPGQIVAKEQRDQQGCNRIPPNDLEKSKLIKNVDAVQEIAETGDRSPEPTFTIRSGLRSKSELKGPSRALRRSGSSSRSNTPSRISKQVSAAKISTLRSVKRTSPPSTTLTPVGTKLPSLTANETAHMPSSSKTSRRKPAVQSAVQSADKSSTPALLAEKRTSKRKSGVTIVDDGEPLALTRSSKRHSTARTSKDDSEDPLALGGSSTVQPIRPNLSDGLFQNMAFAVSYVKREQEKDNVMRLIMDNGGQILQDGFESLFETSKSRPQGLDAGLSLSPMARPLGFSALIADDHSRKAKYMQALALGLPCISGRWVLACVAKGAVLDWSPYLLCAGQSLFLGNAIKSRNLQPYSAADAMLETTLESRDKLLNGKSVLIVMGRGKIAEDKRKPYVFLTRALGPGRVGQVVDLLEARKKLTTSEAEGQPWDLLYVDNQEEAAAATVFGPAKTLSDSSRKRKKAPTATEDTTTHSPKRIRVIVDETMIQSLIQGQLLED